MRPTNLCVTAVSNLHETVSQQGYSETRNSAPIAPSKETSSSMQAYEERLQDQYMGRLLHSRGWYNASQLLKMFRRGDCAGWQPPRCAAGLRTF